MNECKCEYPDYDESEENYLKCRNCGYEEYIGD
jgi:hypothetical protein